MFMQKIDGFQNDLQVWNFCTEGAEIMRAAGSETIPFKREPSEAASESQNLNLARLALIQRSRV